MSVGMTLILIAVSETTAWGWGSAKTIGMLAAGGVICAAWVTVEVRSAQPLIDMTLMRVRAVWTTNLTAFLLGAGMYASFVVFPQFAQLPKSTGFGFGASVVGSALYLLPSTIGMFVVGFAAGRIAARFGSKAALVAGSIVTAAAFGRSRPSTRTYTTCSRAPRCSASGSDSHSRRSATSWCRRSMIIRPASRAG